LSLQLFQQATTPELRHLGCWLKGMPWSRP
jgi:hypothetical protein